MERIKILVVDDEARMRKLVHDYLKHAGYEVVEAEDGQKAVDLFFQSKDIALIVLDVMMPKMDGWQVCREIREFSMVPIIMLTARADERDELLGFQIGVDEYITKPVSPKILVARVEAILRRTNKLVKEETLTCKSIRLDKLAHQCYVNDEPVDLSYKEYQLLVFFMENQNVALSRETILSRVWNYDYEGDSRTIDTHVKKLRSKLGEARDQIVTIRDVGYKMEG